MQIHTPVSISPNPGMQVTLACGPDGAPCEPTPVTAHEAAALCFEQVLQLLEQDRWHGATLARVLPNLTQHLPNAPHAIWEQCLQAMQRHWPHAGEPTHASCEDVGFMFGVLAGALQQWRLAATYLAHAMQTHGVHHATLRNRAIAHWQLAEHEAALACMGQAIRAAPANSDYRRQLALMVAWRQPCAALLGGDRLLAWRGAPHAVFATLLGPHHAAALVRQQDGSDIARLARLPPLASVAEARRWIGEQCAAPGQCALALIDPAHGLIGIAALEQDGDAATFYYWIGQQHRGKGHGRTGLRLLKRCAFKLGIRALYSPVLDENQRSIDLLQRARYRRLQAVTEADMPNVSFYWLSLATCVVQDDATHFARLQRLLHVTGGRPAILRTT